MLLESRKLNCVIVNLFILMLYNRCFTRMNTPDEISRLCTITDSKVINVFTTPQGFKIRSYVKTILRFVRMISCKEIEAIKQFP